MNMWTSFFALEFGFTGYARTAVCDESPTENSTTNSYFLSVSAIGYTLYLCPFGSSTVAVSRFTESADATHMAEISPGLSDTNHTSAR